MLAGKNDDGTPALYIACYKGHVEAIKALLDAVPTFGLSEDDKKELLAGKNKNGTPALYIACMNGGYKIVKILLEVMCSCDINLDMTELKEFMTGKGAYNTPPAFAIAMREGHLETVKVYINAILNNPLGSPAKEKLLTAKTMHSGLSALQLAINERKMDVVNVFVDIVKNSTGLLVNEKDKLLDPYNKHVRKNKQACQILYITIFLNPIMPYLFVNQ